MPGKLTPQVGHRDHIEGPDTASVTLVEYGDYECPYCGEAFSIVKAIQKRLGKAVALRLSTFPTDQCASARRRRGGSGGGGRRAGAILEDARYALRKSGRARRPRPARIRHQNWGLMRRVSPTIWPSIGTRHACARISPAATQRCQRHAQLLHQRRASRPRLRPRYLASRYRRSNVEASLKAHDAKIASRSRATTSVQL